MSVRRVDEIPAADRPGHWILPHWEAAGCTAGVTDHSRDLRLRGRPTDATTRAWAALLGDVPGFRGAAAAPQVHGRRLLSHPVATPGLTVTAEADAHLTPARGLLLGVTVADCVPVYLRHDPSGWLGLLHAGWRGIAAGILEAALDRLATAGAQASDIVMHCGISICGGCYEVGPEVHAAVEARQVRGAATLDLRAALAARARAAGVRAVTLSGLCTREHPAFLSHRGSGGRPERMAAYLGRSLA